MDKKSVVTALIAAGFGTVAFAQDEAAAPGAEAELAVLPSFEAVDANKDGMIDAPESEALTVTLEERHQIEFQFETADGNGDGLINDQEYVAYDAMLKQRLGIA